MGAKNHGDSTARLTIPQSKPALWYARATSENRRITPKALSGFVLFAVILVVSIVIAVVTDMNPIARGAIAVAAGIVAAAASFVLLSRKQKQVDK